MRYSTTDVTPFWSGFAYGSTQPGRLCTEGNGPGGISGKEAGKKDSIRSRKPDVRRRASDYRRRHSDTEHLGPKGLRAWDENLEDGFQPLLTADSDAASVALDDGFDDREPEAASPSVSRP